MVDHITHLQCIKLGLDLTQVASINKVFQLGLDLTQVASSNKVLQLGLDLTQAASNHSSSGNR